MKCTLNNDILEIQRQQAVLIRQLQEHRHHRYVQLLDQNQLVIEIRRNQMNPIAQNKNTAKEQTHNEIIENEHAFLRDNDSDEL